MACGDRSSAREPSLHDAALVVVPGLGAAALIGDVDFYTSDPITEPTQGPLYHGLDLIDQSSAATDVAVGVDLDQHRCILPRRGPRTLHLEGYTSQRDPGDATCLCSSRAEVQAVLEPSPGRQRLATRLHVPDGQHLPLAQDVYGPNGSDAHADPSVDVSVHHPRQRAIRFVLDRRHHQEADPDVGRDGPDATNGIYVTGWARASGCWERPIGAPLTDRLVRAWCARGLKSDSN
jgi:hypothetical protein